MDSYVIGGKYGDGCMISEAQLNMRLCTCGKSTRIGLKKQNVALVGEMHASEGQLCYCCAAAVSAPAAGSPPAHLLMVWSCLGCPQPEHSGCIACVTCWFCATAAAKTLDFGGLITT